ncbi:MAG: hypothetical protein CVV44_06775 [Spirochaetae bacterium HGW-Spirochaetae-1]|jgi:hypothetical protein|nr:MAG: hypothetical protein CVV44_06775 [Spirochaetae bacterium HGW-Spirochaetae-1]
MKKIMVLAFYSLFFVLPMGCAGHSGSDVMITDASGMVAPAEQLLFRNTMDEKLRSFSADTGKLYRIKTAVAADNAPAADTVLILYDSAMTELARNDDKEPGLPGVSLEELKKNPLKLACTLLTMNPDDLEEDGFSEIVWRAPVSGTYHIRVVPQGGSPYSLGAFTLSVSEL